MFLKYYELYEDQTELSKILQAGAQKAQERAKPMLNHIHDLIGFIPLK